ncbi:hypothetical protein CRYUN_Cryun29cG0109200 [Craigia yunnanensis]
MRGKHYRDLAYAVSFLPYYWRSMQCARQWFDEGQTNHLVNLGEYVSAMLAAGAKVAYEKERSIGCLSCCGHVKCCNSVQIVLGLCKGLGLAWLQTVLHSSFEHVDYRVTGVSLAALEVIRRGLWNFYRLENEHLNNAGKFRAVKTVPLPFHEVDEED